MVYTGKQDPIAGIGHAQTVVMDLMSDLLGCYRTVVADNFLTSISLAERWLEHDTYRIGTLRSNRVGSGTKFFRKEFRRAEVYRLQNKDVIKLIMQKQKRDFLMISTRPSHSANLVVDTGKNNIQN
jgi:hypothetical protein